MTGLAGGQCFVPLCLLHRLLFRLHGGSEALGGLLQSTRRQQRQESAVPTERVCPQATAFCQSAFRFFTMVTIYDNTLIAQYSIAARVIIGSVYAINYGREFGVFQFKGTEVYNSPYNKMVFLYATASEEANKRSCGCQRFF